MQQKTHEKRCIALLQKFTDAINIPKPPSMYTPFLVRANVHELFLFQVNFMVLLFFKVLVDDKIIL